MKTVSHTVDTVTDEAQSVFLRGRKNTEEVEEE